MQIPPKKLIRDVYGLPDLSLSPMGRHWRIDVNRRPAYLFKRFSPDRGYVDGVWRCLYFLTQQGLTPSPLWKALQDGGPSLYWQGWHWILIPWVIGSPAPVFTPGGLPRLLRLLNRVHVLGENCSAGACFDPASVYAERARAMEDAMRADRRSAFSDAYRRLLPYYLVQARRSLGLLRPDRDEARSKLTLCHGDPSARNTLEQTDGRWVLVDWDRIVRAPRWWELSQTVRRYGYANAWRFWPLWRVLEREIRPALTCREMQSLWGALLFPQEFWRLGDQAFRERLRRPGSWFAGRLEEIRRLEARRQATLHAWGRAINQTDKV